MHFVDGSDNAATDRPTEAPVSALVASTARLVTTAEAATNQLLCQLAQ